MAVPDFQTVMLPVLNILADGQARQWREVRDRVADEFGLTADERAERLPSGGSRFDNRVQWAHSHLAQAGLISRPQRGHVQITDRGRSVLAEHPHAVDMKLLYRFDEYQEFRSRTRAPSSAADEIDVIEESSGTPWETIGQAVEESSRALAGEVVHRVLEEPPEFLERLVLELLRAMGYGGRTGAAEHLGRSGDGGIDGVIRQDPLGLDRVYIQAKRYGADHAVGRPDIQAFVGALHGAQADRGVFISTSRFSQDAYSYVERIPNQIVLIDGRRLGELMVLHNVGVQDEHTFVLKRIDEDFFDHL